jgi:hypothetical protein
MSYGHYDYTFQLVLHSQSELEDFLGKWYASHDAHRSGFTVSASGIPDRHFNLDHSVRVVHFTHSSGYDNSTPGLKEQLTAIVESITPNRRIGRLNS